MTEKARRLPESLTKALIPIVRAPPSRPHILKALPPNTIIVGVRFSTYEFGVGGHKNSAHSSGFMCGDVWFITECIPDRKELPFSFVIEETSLWISNLLSPSSLT